MKAFSQRVAAVTGAASGMGRALAEELARRGCHLALADINAADLARTATSLAPSGVRISTAIVDVSDRAAVFGWAAAVVREHGHVHWLFNNAGVGFTALAETVRIEDFEWAMNINFWGVVHGTQAFLPHLRASGQGHVVNISSLYGLMAMPTRSPYNASKFAVRGYTEALRMELDMEGGPLSATCVHPGGVSTAFADHGRVDPDVQRLTGESVDLLRQRWNQMLRGTTPQAAARQILDGAARNRRRVLVGRDARFLDMLVRVFAARYQVLLVHLATRLRARLAAGRARQAQRL